jgi:hypothetical protein
MSATDLEVQKTTALIVAEAAKVCTMVQYAGAAMVQAL